MNERLKHFKSTILGVALIIIPFLFFGWMLQSGTITVEEIPVLMENIDQFSWKMVAIVAAVASVAGGAKAVSYKPKK